MAPIRTSTISNPRTCPHLTAYKKLHGSRAYNSLQTILRTMPNGRTTLCRLQSLLPRCHSCSIYNSRLYLCLICSSVLCPADARAHPALLPGHEISVDLDRSELFCCVCADQVYDPEFDSTIVSKQFMGTVSAEDARAKSRTRKRRPPLDYRGHMEPMLNVCWGTKNSSCYPSGLRGLSNLGNTCFMNSVLQVLLHTPPLRNYFLNDQHNREACHLKRRRRKGAVVAGEMTCLVCDMEGVFTAVFSGEWTPYNPAPFLYSWWQHLSNLASYEQQDAHEFFISMLDRIHEKEQSGTRNKGIEDCHCIAHSVFSGILRSDVTCTVCGFTSTTYDPCIDVSLDLEPYDCTTSASRSFKANDNSKISTLMGCLDHFTRAEKLGSDEKLYCEHCEVRQDSVKQMSIRRLPLVLCFHIKRFEHSLITRTTKKIDQYLQFPFSLDMTPYLSSSVTRSRFGNRIFAFEGDKSDDSSSEFEVFAMVTHSGGMESGHYVTYLRLRNQWYKCDDAWITQVSEGVVRAAQCYMIYYLQKVLYHRASEDIDCLPVSPREWNN